MFYSGITVCNGFVLLHLDVYSVRRAQYRRHSLNERIHENQGFCEILYRQFGGQKKTGKK